MNHTKEIHHEKQCPVCDERIEKKSSLRQHMAEHHLEMPHPNMKSLQFIEFETPDNKLEEIILEVEKDNEESECNESTIQSIPQVNNLPEVKETQKVSTEMAKTKIQEDSKSTW